MKCDEIQELYPEYWESQLLPEARKSVTIHLQKCNECEQGYQEFQAAMRFLKENKPVLPTPENFMVRVLSESNHFLLKQKTRRFTSSFALAAALLFLSFLTNLYFFSQAFTTNETEKYLGMLYNGKEWISEESVVLDALNQEQVLEKVKRHPTIQPLIETKKGTQELLQEEHLKLKQNGLLLSSQEKEVLEKGFEQFSRLSPDASTMTSSLSSMLYGITIGNGYLVQGFFFYPLYLDEDQQQSFLDFKSALSQGKVKISQGQEPSLVRFKSFASRPIMIRAGETLISKNADYIISQPFVLEPNKEFEIDVICLPSKTEAKTATLSIEGVSFTPPSLLSLLAQSSTSESLRQRLTQIKSLLSSSANNESSKESHSLRHIVELQKNCQTIVNEFPYPQNPAPAGWVVLCHNRVLYSEILSSPQLMKNSFKTLVQALLVECAAHYGCLGHYKKNHSWPPIKDLFVHKQFVHNFLQQVLGLRTQSYELSKQASVVLLNPKKVVGVGLSLQKQMIQLQILKDPTEEVAFQSQKISPSNQMLWNKLLKTSQIKSQEQLFQRLLSRLSEQEYERLWQQILKQKKVGIHQMFLRLLLKKRPKNFGTILENWLAYLSEREILFEVSLQIIDAIALVKQVSAIDLLLDLVENSATPMKNREQTLEAINLLFLSASRETQKEIQNRLLLFGEKLTESKTPKEQKLLKKLLDLFAKISGKVGGDLAFYQKLWR